MASWTEVLAPSEDVVPPNAETIPQSVLANESRGLQSLGMKLANTFKHRYQTRTLNGIAYVYPVDPTDVPFSKAER